MWANASAQMSFPRMKRVVMNHDHVKAVITDLEINAIGPMHCRPKHASTFNLGVSKKTTIRYR